MPSQKSTPDKINKKIKMEEKRRRKEREREFVEKIQRIYLFKNQTTQPINRTQNDFLFDIIYPK